MQPACKPTILAANRGFGLKILGNKAHFQASRAVQWQSLISLAIVLAGWILRGNDLGLPLLLGSIACIIPSFYFVSRLKGFTGARSAKRSLRSLYKGEAVKLLMSGVLLLVMIKTIDFSIPLFIVGYLVAQLTLTSMLVKEMIKQSQVKV